MQAEVTFPTDHPIPFVSVEPVPGWQVNVERRTLDQPTSGEGEDITDVVSKITWSGGTIQAGQFQRFPVPTLTLTASTGDEHGGSSDDEAATDDTAKTIGIVGVVFGALGLIIAIVALVRKPKTS